jgi:GNAT superfamily N-acetyltransferase
VELVLRDARLSDIDRIVGLMERADGRLNLEQLSDAADVLRQMIYLPNASVIVALDGRTILGVAVLALRSSVVAGGLVGTIDVISVEPGHELDGVFEALLKELLRSARNKGCSLVEGNLPEDPSELARWQALGFAEAGARLRRQLVRAAALAW